MGEIERERERGVEIMPGRVRLRKAETLKEQENGRERKRERGRERERERERERLVERLRVETE